MSQHQKRPPVYRPAEEDVAKEEISLPLKAAEPQIEPPKVAEPTVKKSVWNVITEAQHDGKYYIVTHDQSQDGVPAFWRKSRQLKHFRWSLHGVWTDAMNKGLIPQPTHYRV